MDNTPKNPQINEEEAKRKLKAVKWIMMDAMIEFALYIGLPLYFLVKLGKWLNAKYNHEYFIIIAIFLSIGISVLLIGIRIKQFKETLKGK